MASSPPMTELVAFLEASPPGARVWVRGAGRSMYPLLRGGDAVQVERCAGSAGVRPGDIALVRLGGGGLAAHVVRAVEPLRTSAFLGRMDEGPAHLLGRVVAIRRAGLLLPVGGRLAPLVLALHRASAYAAGSSRMRRGVRWLRGAVATPATREVRRRWLGALQVRGLGPEDAEVLLLYAGDALRGPTAFLGQAPRERRGREVVGAFTRHGRLVGFAAREGAWLRSLHVTEGARRLGVGTRLLRALCAATSQQGEPALYAAVRPEESACWRLLSREGFREVPGPGSGRCVLVRTLGG
jgi:ribosomal protein S18 acetylase RimI-like enzyme